MKRLLTATVLCILFSLPSFGQANSFRRFEINYDALAYMRQGGSDFAGGGIGFAFHATPHWAIVVEERIDELINLSSFHLSTYRFGPRYTRTHGNRLTLFSEVLAGGALATSTTSLFSSSPSTKITSTTSTSGYTVTAGGGLDFGIRPWIAWRAVQAEYSFLHIGNNTNGVRIGTGLVFRFGK